MNLNGDEKRIQQLFREMSLDDQRRAPQFARLLAEANSGKAHARNRFPALRFAIAVAMLCVALLIAMVVIVKPSKPLDAMVPGDQTLAPTAPEVLAAAIDQSRPVSEAPRVEHKKVIRRVRWQRPSTHAEISTKSLFAWQSPTASLMQTPNDELLRSLPRLGESLQTIKSFSPDEFN